MLSYYYNFLMIGYIAKTRLQHILQIYTFIHKKGIAKFLFIYNIYFIQIIKTFQVITNKQKQLIYPQLYRRDLHLKCTHIHKHATDIQDNFFLPESEQQRQQNGIYVINTHYYTLFAAYIANYTKQTFIMLYYYIG